MSVKFLLLRGGILAFLGGECQFYFYGHEDFCDIRNIQASANAWAQGIPKKGCSEVCSSAHPTSSITAIDQDDRP